jgi:Tfp pilus assembly protein PilO
MIDWQRAAAEKRSLIAPLALLAILNVAAYAFFIYPLATQAGSVEARAASASASLRKAAADFNSAQAIKTGRERADAQLTRFYDQILPQDLAGARRITHLRLAKLAEESNLDLERRNVTTKHDRDSVLERMHMTMELTGDYRDVREFLHKLETAPEFLVIEDVALAQEESDAALALTVKLATFFRARP